MKTETVNAQYLNIAGRRVVVLEETAFADLLHKADLWEPALPEPDANGNYPAFEFASVSMARDILRARRKLGLSQAELARRAGIRQETLNRIENACNKISVPTIDKIDRALKKAEAEYRKARNGK